MKSLTGMYSLEKNKQIYQALVADLSHTAVPTSTMGLTLVMVALVTFVTTGNILLLIFGALGGCGTLVKLCLILKSSGEDKRLTVAHTKSRERAHFAATSLVATSVGALAAELFLQFDVSMHLLGTGLLFGYCSGVVCRISIRPFMASTALAIAAVPAIAAAMTWPDAMHRLFAGFLLIFLLAGYQSVWHVYRTAVRHIATRLEMESLARIDHLTKLANRTGLQLAFENAQERFGSVAVYCLDLDGFKRVNDRFGHAAGDQVLLKVSARINACLPDSALAARIGGDEFVVLQETDRDECQAEEVARNIVESLAIPFIIDGRSIVLGASLGFVTATAAASNLDELLCAADLAAYQVKRRGGGAILRHCA